MPKYSQIDIVGLRQGSHGRQCSIHPMNCGVAVALGTKLKVLKSVIQVPKSVLMETEVSFDLLFLKDVEYS